MAENAHTLDDLRQMQAYPLDIKVGLTRNRIHGWIRQHPSFVSFSGGKDSTVILHIARQVDPHIPAVHLDTRTEHRSLRAVVKATDNVITIKPEINFAEAVDQCGWCVPHKEIADVIYGVRNGNKSDSQQMAGLDKNDQPNKYRAEKFIPYAYLLDAPFTISNLCCDRLKKDPFIKFERENYMTSIVGTLAADSPNRQMAWLKNGCNAWDAKRPKSQPLSFWTQQDILRYVLQNDLQVASVYGDIVERDGKLRTTGVDHTGCVCCPVGAKRFGKYQLSKFELLARDEPLYHVGLMRSKIGLREALLWIEAPLGCAVCGGRCYCGADPYAPRFKGECRRQLALPLGKTKK